MNSSSWQYRFLFLLQIQRTLVDFNESFVRASWVEFDSLHIPCETHFTGTLWICYKTCFIYIGELVVFLHTFRLTAMYSTSQEVFVLLLLSFGKNILLMTLNRKWFEDFITGITWSLACLGGDIYRKIFSCTFSP